MSFSDDLTTTEALRPSEPCEFRHPARREWRAGTVIANGGSGYWHVRDDESGKVHSLYIECVRAPGTDPWGATT